LLEFLARDEGSALTLLSAPAGFGKTTLLCEWLQDPSRGRRYVAWVSLDEWDNDPARFLRYLVGALRTVEEGVGGEVLASLRSPTLPPVEAMVGALVNELAGLPQEVSVVLDDYHLIDSERVHEAVSFLIEHMPENVRLFVSGRTDPPLPLPRLRARGRMRELRSSDLRFTPEEATAFLNDVMGLALSSKDVTALDEVTEGWVAALQLAALSMRDRGDVSGFVRAFSGSNRHILDFLSEEVLEEQPEGVRLFLLSTSVLESMSAPLCDTLTGRGDGQEMLERLERENLFVVALDDERRWYRYHHLFAEFLRGRLLRESPELAGELHLLASGWYEENGMVAEAVGHALAAPDHDLAARLIERAVEGAQSRGEFPTVLRWLEALPGEAKRRRPRLLAVHAWALTITGRSEDVEPLLEEIERAETAGEDQRFLLGLASAVRSWRARLRGEAPAAVEHARRALSLLANEDVTQRNLAAICLGGALRITGDLEEAGEALAEAVEYGRAAGHTYGTLTAMVLQGRVWAEQGRLREAEGAFRRALRLVTEEGFELLPAAGLVHIGMADLLYERDDIDGAERELERGIQLARLTKEVSALVWGHITSSQVRRARGDEDGALEMAREAERVAHASGADLQVAIAGAWMTRLRIARGDLAEAVAFEKSRTTDADDATDAARAVDLLTSTRLLIVRGRQNEALRLLEGPQKAAETTGRTGDLIEVLALRALALWAGNEGELAVSTLAQALAVAETGGYVRIFFDEGARMAELLKATLEARQRGRLYDAGCVSARYLAKLLATFAQDAATPVVAEGLPEPLSDRELEVLALIAAGESNADIARKLFISISTVKTHVNNLFRKVGARNRAQAIVLAREKGLI
jgi:LuxR family maltose regulon positive regulatory protein